LSWCFNYVVIALLNNPVGAEYFEFLSKSVISVELLFIV
jgi:hypothetical protein